MQESTGTMMGTETIETTETMATTTKRRKRTRRRTEWLWVKAGLLCAMKRDCTCWAFQDATSGRGSAAAREVAERKRQSRWNRALPSGNLQDLRLNVFSVVRAGHANLLHWQQRHWRLDTTPAHTVLPMGCAATAVKNGNVEAAQWAYEHLIGAILGWIANNSEIMHAGVRFALQQALTTANPECAEIVRHVVRALDDGDLARFGPERIREVYSAGMLAAAAAGSLEWVEQFAQRIPPPPSPPPAPPELPSAATAQAEQAYPFFWVTRSPDKPRRTYSVLLEGRQFREPWDHVLNAAAEGGNVGVVETVIRMGATVVPIQDGMSTVDRAAPLGSVDVTRFLLEHTDAPVSTAALELAVRHAHLPLLEYLHDYFRRSPERCGTHYPSVRLMDTAAKWGNTAIVRYLHTHGQCDHTGHALESAARAGATSMVEYLLNEVDVGWSSTALLYALSSPSNSSVDTVRILLRAASWDRCKTGLALRQLRMAVERTAEAGQEAMLAQILDACPYSHLLVTANACKRAASPPRQVCCLKRLLPYMAPLDWETCLAQERNPERSAYLEESWQEAAAVVQPGYALAELAAQQQQQQLLLQKYSQRKQEEEQR